MKNTDRGSEHLSKPERRIRNVLYIMSDQLRADHLSCYGHPRLETPNIDWLASRGVLFDRAYVTSGVCGPSRMSSYTGRYMSSHGATWNHVPLSVSELTMGDYLCGSGLKAALVGKTHVKPDLSGLDRLKMENDDSYTRLIKGGFSEVDRYDGHAPPGAESGYGGYLRAHGYAGDDPWNDYVVSGERPDGEVVSGWSMRNAKYPARVAEAHSETAYTTDQAIHYIQQQGDAPWVLHLSYIKPHWPFIAPAPYHDMYGIEDCTPLIRADHERDNPHPVVAAYQQHRESLAFARDEVVETVRPVYMGLIKQLDDHLGRLWEELKRLGRLDDTLIIFTSDHGDYMGDHWLGEKELFFEQSVRVPYIVYDPSGEADATRGTVEKRFTECVDTLPTILDALGIGGYDHRIEGKSVLPLVRNGDAGDWRTFAVSELDYAYRGARHTLARKPDECRGWMIRTERWKYIEWSGLPCQLYDLENDPNEFHDLGSSPEHAGVQDEMKAHLFEWLKSLKSRTTVSYQQVEDKTDNDSKFGVHIGIW
ncbi:sulfatase [Marinobacterium nitratireducens]|uniref:Sulfatase n=1 Tax=Marinobacterium nitratireducens TaxID=518897 RepID=A0A917ZK72_9GAMM|nr:sulfatase-like hydrolase/transferase [Marinobacterium nitratireducens]GGO85381.1 sulfatase [Marinobacterium nitratireducens]